MITAAQDKGPSIAGLLANVSTLRVLRRRGDLSKPVTLWGTEGGAQNTGWNFWNRDSDSFHTCSKHFCESIKNGLMFYVIQVYGYCASAKSGAGIGVLIICIVPTRTKRVFLSAKFLRTQIMVGWMRLPKGRPVSIQAGYANLVQLTTSLRLASLGGEFTIHCIEAATMATTLTPKTSFIWIIAAIRRDSQSATVKIFHVTAASEREARHTLVRDHVCFFAGRIRLTEVDHA
ncbi:host cell division inhibitor Icd-like protein [Raoultella ornithinolytica]|uniref:host cell division inhibitor Icd-like protein n=1 Tax=Raoultella ornithinolytica TaxID=54291 RepID=UPI0015DBD76D|nr:host cell division inhibitor Icd-like protein [Raoultella ornithinolytica]EJD6650386.1 host cell division inhibitor Icd-like protein [Raoultella ornithinolytica]ELV3660125.1 host cell division inhibitor Icd-like protein [Raoultella ornithinolytica]BBJ87667.1 hypothetical protein ROGSH02058M1_038660 [Raoultella ornithinolytica]BBT86604.1 hypothetical protein WP8W19C01_38450 [Raoultella ornithinolytica]